LNPRAFFQIGCILSNSPDTIQEAIINYIKAVEIKPDYVMALYNLGQIYQNLKNYKDAVDIFLKVIQYAPSDWQARGKVIQLFQVN
jgi:tetratricopeptide (TPR) repeat protein